MDFNSTLEKLHMFKGLVKYLEVSPSYGCRRNQYYTIFAWSLLDSYTKVSTKNIILPKTVKI